MIIRSFIQRIPCQTHTTVLQTGQAWRLRCPRNPIIPSKPFHHSRLASSEDTNAQIDHLQDLYATAKDELEIASEETDKKSVYASEDRNAAIDAFNDFKQAYERAVEEEGKDPGSGEGIRGRIGQRVREMENAVEALSERAKED